MLMAALLHEVTSAHRTAYASVAAIALCALAATSRDAALQPAGSNGVAEKSYQQTYQDATSKIVNEPLDQSKFQNLGQGVLWRYRFGLPNTRYIRFRFDNIHSPQGLTYRIRVVRDPAGEEVANYPADRFAQESSFMTELLPPGDLRVELKADTPPQGLVFRLERVLWQAQSSQAVPHSNLLKFKFIRTLPQGSPALEAAPSVVLLHIGPFATSCTGVLVDRSTVATNYHCMEKSFSFRATEQTSKPSCADVLAEFDYLEADQRGSTSPCLAVRAKKELDVALLSFDVEAIRLASGKERAPTEIRPAAEGTVKTSNLIHHPLGLPLVIEENCSVPSVEQLDLLHDCNSTPGSSGSPLFDGQMRWIGLHYKGPFPNEWTFQEWYQDFLKNGPKYNRAKLSQAVSQFLKE